MPHRIAQWQQQRGSRHAGFTMLELVMAMTLLAAVSGLAMLGWRPLANRLEINGFAHKVQAGLQRSRFEAIKRNRVVVFFWDSDQQSFQTVVKSPTNAGCDIDNGDLALAPVLLPDPPGLRDAIDIQGTFVSEQGIAWKVNGLTASCNNFEGTGGNTLEVRFDEIPSGARNIDIEISLGGGISMQFLD
ncbi:MAG: prepilin-type N-terminal cleavage/methylation domain-containing protein [Synechococcus sp.]